MSGPKRPRSFPVAALFAVLLVGCLFHATSRADGPTEVPAKPAEKVNILQGTPTIVQTAVQFVRVDAIDENAQTFDAMVDVRLTWQATGAPVTDVEGEEVDAALEAIGAPEFYLANLMGDPSFHERGLTVDKHGTVELLERTAGTFAAQFDAHDFPFDTQSLPVEVAVKRAKLEEVNLEFHGSDVAFSNDGAPVETPGWGMTIVDLERDPLAGWHGKSHGRVIAKLQATRNWGAAIGSVFIPLFSSMLIPLIAIWLQKVSDEGEFEVDAFELANIVIGGLFAVIALNLTINADHAMLASGDNTLTRLFGLNYSTLAIALVIDIVLFQFNWGAKLFGKYVQEQMYLVLSWAVPMVSIGAGLAFLLVSWF